MSVTVGVVPREVEEVDAREDDEETAEKRDSVDGGCGVETLEQKKGCDERASGKGYVIEGVDAVHCQYF
jgi:hypothetical protein